MNKAYYYLNSIDGEKDESCKDFLNFINNNKKIKVYISCNGGSNHTTHAIIDALNERKDDIELHVCGFLSSNTFMIFFKFKGKRTLGYESSSYLHYSGGDMRIMSNGKKEYAQDRYDSKFARTIYKRDKKFFEDLGLNKTEMNKLEKGDTVFLDYNRLQELNAQS